MIAIVCVAGRPGTGPVIGAAFGVTLARAQGGDETAFACLFRDVQPALLRYLQVLTLEAEDVASDTWLQVVRGLPGFRAAAGISILAAYADVLPTPVQQLAHAAAQRRPRTTAASGCPWRRRPAPQRPAGVRGAETIAENPTASSPVRSAPPAHRTPGPVTGTSRPAAWPARPTRRRTQRPIRASTTPRCEPSLGLSRKPRYGRPGRPPRRTGHGRALHRADTVQPLRDWTHPALAIAFSSTPGQTG